MLSILTFCAYDKMLFLEHLPTRLPHLLTMFLLVRIASFFPARKAAEKWLPFKVKKRVRVYKHDRILGINLIFQTLK